jgi:large subunit ribosomal protein L1
MGALQRLSARFSATSLSKPTAVSCSIHTNALIRSYVSRAHPTVKPVYAINEALEDLLEDIQRRGRLRQRKWNRNATTPEEEATVQARTHMDETVEIALNLNLDPRKPGQALRGSINLPNGTGKSFNCIVFTDDEELREAALAAGAAHAGGTALMDALLAGEVPVDSLDRSLATANLMPTLSKKVARLLGPRGLMPNAKTGTLVAPDALLGALATQVAGREVQYRTEREGVVHVPVGKASFGADKLLENMGAVLKEIYAVKPEQYGKGKKSTGKAAGKAAKYMLKAFVSSTQGPSVGVDVRTVDPNSPFFLTSVETGPDAEDEAA